MAEEMKELSLEELEKTAGGAAGVDYVHDLSHYVHKTVCNLPVGTCLVMQSAPGGAPLGGIQFYEVLAECTVHRSHCTA